MCLPLFAQQTGMSGRVSDPSGAMVTSAAVSSTGEDGTKVSTTTNTTGLYQFPGLRAGTYKPAPEAIASAILDDAEPDARLDAEA